MYGGTTTTINFQIDNPGNYCATVFADYIPVGFTATEGHYPDQYYDTTVPGIITVNSTGSDFLNNENRDCFLGKVVFKKGLNALERDLVLTRPVSRVLISAPSDDVETLIKKVEITVCSHLGSYEFAIDNTETVGSPVTTATDPLATSGSVNVNPDGKKLFYFYTFAGDFGDDNRPALGEIQFTLSPKEGIKLKTTDRSIAAGVIKPAVNYQLSVTGNKGWIDAAPGADDITVTIQNLPDWSNNPQNINGL